VEERGKRSLRMLGKILFFVLVERETEAFSIITLIEK